MGDKCPWESSLISLKLDLLHKLSIVISQKDLVWEVPSLPKPQWLTLTVDIQGTKKSSASILMFMWAKNASHNLPYFELGEGLML